MKVTTVSTDKLAWAIDTRSTEGHGFLGVFYVGNHVTLAPWQDGNRTALFRTRQQAREWLRTEKSKEYQGFPRAQVARVKITIERTDAD